MVFKLVKEVRDVNRFREILAVLFEEGFDFLIGKIKLKHKIPLTKRVKKPKDKTHSNEKRLRLTLERLGPTFIKFGQVLSIRPDLIPKNYIKELEKLQDDIPPFSYEEVKEQIKNELGKDINKIFPSFDKKPIAAASISQVHKATLKDGAQVAVKIQRPDVHKLMRTDIELMFYFSKLLEKHIPKIRRYGPVQIVEEFAKWTEKELDFKKEAINAKRFARDFSKDNRVHIPKIYDEFTTNKILVMEFIEGTELHNIKKLKRQKVDISHIIEQGYDIVLTQVFIRGFFHADPHPGNIIITPDEKIAFVDFGIVGRFDEKLKNQSIDLFYGIVENNPEQIVNTLIDLCNKQVENKEELKDDIEDIVSPLQGKDISEVKVSYVLEEIYDVALEYGLRIPVSFVLFGKTMITLEGVALEYDPKLKPIEFAKPFIETLIAKRYNPINVFNSMMKNMLKFRKLAEEIPEQTSKTLKSIEKGTIHVNIDDTDIKMLSVEIDRSGNRVAYSMLIASLLIVGALTVNAGEAFLLNTPAIPFFSFLVALILSLILLHSILREKNIIN